MQNDKFLTIKALKRNFVALGIFSTVGYRIMSKTQVQSMKLFIKFLVKQKSTVPCMDAEKSSDYVVILFILI